MAYPKNQQVGSGQFTNLKQYIEANKPGADRIAGAVTSQVGQQAQNISSGVDTEQSQFMTEAEKKQSSLNEAKQFGEGVLQKASTIGQKAAQPELDRFKALTSGTERYDDIQARDLSKQQEQSNILQNKAKQAQQSSGRAQLLQDTFGNREYSRGQQAVDSLILGTNKAARENVAKTIQSQAANIANQVKSAQESQAQKIQAIKDAQAGLQSGLRTGVQTGMQNVEQELKSAADLYNQRVRETSEGLESGLRRGELSQAVLARLSPEDQERVRQLSGKSLTDFYNKQQSYLSPSRVLDQSSDIDLTAIAKQQQIDRQRALEELAGVGISKYTGSDIGKYDADVLKGSDINLDTLLSARDAQEKEIEAQRLAGRQQAAKELNELYYGSYGESTGYGYNPGDRNVTASTLSALNDGRGLTQQDLNILYPSAPAQQLSNEINSAKAAKEAFMKDALEKGGDFNSLISSKEVKAFDQRINNAQAAFDATDVSKARETTSAQQLNSELEAKRQAIEQLRSGRLGQNIRLV